MIPNDPERRKEMIAMMLGAFSDEDREAMTKWEQDFIESIDAQFSDRGNLSDKQCEILERIYDKIK